jgi:maltooligosyltrehalose trehalohydrolase
MGEEYGETTPFLYFVSHSDPELIETIREGRKKEFKAFNWGKEPSDPQDEETFLKSKIKWDKRYKGNNRILLNFYKELIHLRKFIPALANLDKDCLDVRGDEEKKIIYIRRWKENSHIFGVFNFNKKDIKFRYQLLYRGWKKLFDSSDKMWNGPGDILPEWIEQDEEFSIRRESFALYVKKET